MSRPAYEYVLVKGTRIQPHDYGKAKWIKVPKYIDLDEDIFPGGISYLRKILTPRQYELVLLVSEGYSFRKSAELMSISHQRVLVMWKSIKPKIKSVVSPTPFGYVVKE